MTETGKNPVTPGSGRRNIFFETGEQFLEDRALRLGAGLAYYAVVTAAPLLVLLVGLAGLIVGEEARNGDLAKSLTEGLGPEISQFIQETIVSLDVAGTFANLTIISVAILFFTASILFVAWKDALNVIWRIEYRGGVRDTLKKRLFAFAVVGGLAILFVVIILAETLLAMLDGFLSDEALIDAALRVASSSVAVLLGTLLLGAIFRFGPDVRVSWRAIWPGTLLTSALFLLVSWGYGSYLDAFGNSSVAGVASSAMLLIVLIYVIAQISMYGAEFIKVLSQRQRLNDSGSG